MSKEIEKVLFVNIATVAQQESYDLLDPSWKMLWDQRQESKETEKSLAEIYVENGSLYSEFAKIVCLSIGAILFREGTPSIYVKAITGAEEHILTQFINCANNGKYDTPAAHGGKGFHFPFISRRCIANGLTIPKIIDFRNKKPWEINAIDTQEMWRFGGWNSQSSSINLVAKCLNVSITDKAADTHNDYYVKKDISSIVNLCSSNVVHCARIYLKIINPSLSVDNYKMVG